MEQRGDQVDLSSIIFGGFTRKTEEDIPRDVDVVVEAPLQTDDVLHRRDAFIHRTKLVQAETLQARLHAFHPSSRQGANLILVKVAFRLNEDIEVAVVGGELSEQSLD